MSADKDDAAGAPPADADAAKKAKKKKMMIGGVAAVLLLGGGGGGYMMLGGKPAATHGEPAGDEGHGEEPAEEAGGEGGGDAKDAGLPVDVPPILVNLRSPDGATRFLKIHFMLVPGKKTTLEELTKKLPLLIDAYQPFLRELRPEDLSGAAAVYRVKEELMIRATQRLGEGQVADVLMQDLVQQ